MSADIAFCCGSKHGVTQGMQGDIAVRMGGQAFFMVYSDTTEHDMVALTKGVYVNTLSDPNFHFHCFIQLLNPLVQEV